MSPNARPPVPGLNSGEAGVGVALAIAHATRGRYARQDRGRREGSAKQNHHAARPNMADITASVVMSAPVISRRHLVFAKNQHATAQSTRISSISPERMTSPMPSGRQAAEDVVEHMARRHIDAARGSLSSSLAVPSARARASSTFCWLPPESVVIGASGLGASDRAVSRGRSRSVRRRSAVLIRPRRASLANGRDGKIVEHRLGRKDAGRPPVARQVGDAAGDRLAEAGDVARPAGGVDRDPAAEGAFKPGQHLQKSLLAMAVEAGKADDLAAAMRLRGRLALPGLRRERLSVSQGRAVRSMRQLRRRLRRHAP